ncbi:hypothetical protein KC966_18090, partial [Proteus terrae]|uniref:glycosyltransferase family 9 protein n=1 Tax=Proteus terrae TaxID=1574161 RepID=UPI003314E2BC
IDNAGLFIGVDSVAMHMAAALKTPLVALFGPSKLEHWHPWQAKGETNPDWHIHLCNPRKLGRISRESDFAKAARACWQEHHFDIV